MAVTRDFAIDTNYNSASCSKPYGYERVRLQIESYGAEMDETIQVSDGRNLLRALQQFFEEYDKEKGLK